MALFSELFLIGYPPEDLALKPAAVRGLPRRRWSGSRSGHRERLRRPWSTCPGRGDGRPAAQRRGADREGEVKDVSFKVDLPNYGVFDEKRIFAAGDWTRPVRGRGREDRRAGLRGHLGTAPLRRPAGRAGAEILLVPNGSPYPPHRR